MMGITSAIASFLFLFLLLARPVFAVSEPSFPVCTNPSGDIQSPATSGNHGIVGSLATYTGRDTVYKVNAPQGYMQCFCGDSGEGIQTNWWKADGLTDAEIAVLKSQGWTFVPNGALWGLENAPYLAKNTTFSCKSDSSSSRIGGDSATNTSGGGVSSGALGLATTGNISFIFTLSTTGLIFLLVSLLLKRQAHE